VEHDPPDVVVVDIRMSPSFSDEGLQVAARLRERNPHVGVLLLSTYADAEYASALLRVGRDRVGYMLKDRIDSAAKLADGVNRVAAGECVIDSVIVTRLLDRERGRSLLEGLSERERDVLRHMAEGRSNAGIARLLHLQLTTVEKHVAAVFSALRLVRESDNNRRVAAVLMWLQSSGRTTAD
jgi:DNA-binding NarL/FixJ family response regulator